MSTEEERIISYFDEVQDFFEEGYRRAEQSRLLFWERLSQAQDKMQVLGAIEKKDRITLGKAEYEDNVLRIVIDDYLPRRVNVVRAPLFSMNWVTPIIEALEILEATQNVRPEFNNKAFCAIIAYLPKNVPWDTDNRAFKLIIDGLRYTKIIPGDTWDKLTYMLIGRVDADYPRTEIYVTDWEKVMESGAGFLPSDL